MARTQHFAIAAGYRASAIPTWARISEKFNVSLFSLGGGPGGGVNAACLKSRRLRVRAPLWHSSLKEIKCFFPAHS